LRKEEKEVASAIEKYEATREAELGYAFFEGKAEVARAMLEEGLSLETVAKCAGMSLVDVMTLDRQGTS
jgi:hypothetical protein